MSIWRILGHLARLFERQDNTDDAGRHQDDTKTFRAELLLPQAAYEQWQTDQKTNHAHQEEILRVERKRLRIEKWTLGLVVSGVLGAFGNLWLMNDSIKEARKATEAAVVAGRAAENQLVITLGQIDQAHEAIRLERRAWVGVVGPSELNIREGQAGRITVRFRNSGQTPALNVYTQVWPVVKRAGDAISFIVPKPLPDASRSAVFPDAERQHSINVGPNLTAADLQALRTGLVIIYVMGRITYRDVFQQEHWTNFCMFIRTDFERVGYCDRFNDAN